MKRNILWIIVGTTILFLAAVAIYLYRSGAIKPRAEGEIVALSIDPSSGTHDLNETFDLNIQLNTAGIVVDGVDLKNLKFDPQILEIQDVDPAAVGTQILVKSSVLTQVTLNSADQASGTVTLSIATPAGASGFSGVETIATVSFKAKNIASATNVSFDFQLGDTTDTNVMSAGADVLVAVGSGAYTIQETPPPTPTVDLKANDSDGPIEIESGQAAKLSWTATPEGAICTASDGDSGWPGVRDLSGDYTSGALTQATVFRLSCTNGGDPVNDSVTVNIKELPPAPLPDVTVRVNGRKEVTIGSSDSVTLTWTSTNADTCVASGSWSGTQAKSGSTTLGPFTQAKSYTLTCTNSVGNVHDRAFIYIENQPPPVIPAVNIKANNLEGPITINYNQAASLSWGSTDADTCIASNGWSGSKATSGEESTGPLTESETYTLTCSKGENNSVDSVTVNVSGQPSAKPGPSDGNITTATTTPSSIATTKPRTTKTTTASKTQQLYQGGVIKPWALWVFYAVIPLSITGAIVFFYIKRKRQKTDQSSNDDLNNLPGDWPNSSI